MPSVITDHEEIIESGPANGNHLPGSTEVTELISSRPGFLVRWGITILFLITIFLLSATWFIQYPDIVTANGYLNSINAPKEVITKTDGKLVRLFVKEGKDININEVIGYIESTADHKEVIDISDQLDTVAALIRNNRTNEILNLDSRPPGKLGELQSSYQTYMQALRQFGSYLAGGFYIRKRIMLGEDIGFLDRMHTTLIQQKNILSQDLLLADSTFKANEILKNQKVISPFDYRTEKSKMLAKEMGLPQITSTIITNENQRHEKLKEVAELENQIQQQKGIFIQALNTFRSNVDDWEKRYLLVAPIGGKVSFVSFLQENQQLKAGQLICFISPGNADYYLEVTVPQYNFGKIEIGQPVRLKLPAYPFNEFGFVKGKVEFINTIPSDSGYRAKISLPDGLKTSYKKEVQYRMGLSVQADIVTSNKRLLVRLLESLIKIGSR